MICVSACLAGEKCRYDGRSRRIGRIADLVKEGNAVAVCPEREGGLSIPRAPSEQKDGRVINKEGKDVTEAFEKGASVCLDRALAAGCETAILKENSPSCGVHAVYDGTFSGKSIPGEGIFTRKCREAGIICRSESEEIEDERSL